MTTKPIISIRLPAEEISFYKNLAEDQEIPVTELIARALRLTYKPPLKHQWRCGICGKPQKPDSIDDCTGVYNEDDIEDDTLQI